MLELMLLALVGLIVGAFGTVVGVGGGFLLVPVLLFAYPSLDPSTVTAMSLVAVCANALSGAAAYGRQRRIDFASGGLMAAASLPGAYLGAVAVRHVERSTFVVVFAVVLALLGGMLLLPRGTQRIRAPLVGRGIFARSITDRQGDTFVYRYRVWQGLVIGVGVGFISSLLGIGGGILQVPMMSTVLRFPVHIATATSQFVLALTALWAVVLHLLAGTLGWDRSLALAATMGAGGVAGAQIGARFARGLDGAIILRALGVAMILVALRMLLAR